MLAALEEQGVTAGDLNPKHPPGHESLTLANGESVPRRRARKRKLKGKFDLDPVLDIR